MSHDLHVTLLKARGHGLSERKAKELQEHMTQSAWSSHVDHSPHAVPQINRIPPTRELSRRPHRPGRYALSCMWQGLQYWGAVILCVHVCVCVCVCLCVCVVVVVVVKVLRATGKIQNETKAKLRPSNCILLEARGSGYN